ncbi:MAG: anthranilate synthase component I [Blastocatellia bacterium]|nr:anthranilate synthase component I [Blastocatellia bacterium]MCX7752452.1 anthranilate synthase component I [Blastocatellia bacterium]MDW8167433.1 anthranilate synthase component I [Acidobacteriota bacterium]
MGVIRPTFGEVRELARRGNIIPVTKVITADLLTPVLAFLRLRPQARFPFLLESVEGGEKIARYSFIGANPHTVIRAREDRCVIETNHERVERADAFLDLLRELTASYHPVTWPGLPPFTAGAVGYMSYDAVRWFERIPARARNDLPLDLAQMMFYSTLLAFDHARHQIHLIANVFTGGREHRLKEKYEQAVAEIEAMEARLQRSVEVPRAKAPASSLLVRSNMMRDEFEQRVRQAKDYIARGEAFQIVLSQRFEVEVGDLDPFQVYRALRMLNPSPYMFYMELEETHLVGASPEMLVRIVGDEITYRPIAGTRPRGMTDAEDRALEADLLADEKERAEHVMLVDLGRNDVGRVAEYGSVEVTDLMVVERYSHVMHLVSTIRGRRRPDKDRFDVLAACFPAGTVTGAPKIRAMEIIDELEPTRRGIYAGTVLYADYSGNLDSCIVIRTALIRNGRAYVQAGAGIVADSIPEREYQETVNKARSVIRAIEVASTEL